MLRNYLSGSVTADDREHINDWYNQLDKAEARFRNPFVKRRVKQNLWENIQTSTGIFAAESRQMYWQAAAAIILMVSAGLLFFYKTQHGYREQQIAYRTITVPAGETKNIKLADGSEIYLNSGAVFNYPAAFADTARQVRLLKGEAFFSVAKDADRPFRISSGKITTTVLGTSFNIRTLKRSGLYQIKVMTGKVRVSAGGSELATLTKNAGLEANLINGKKLALIKHSESNPSWMSGSVELESASFQELSDVMELYYGIQLQSDDEHVLQGSYSLSFNRKDKADTVLEIISSIKRMQYERKGNRVIIK